jgi:hypothetical protein
MQWQQLINERVTYALMQPNGLSPLSFKKLKYCLAEPLDIVFTQSISVGYVPDDWKKAIIMPVVKKGSSGRV